MPLEKMIPAIEPICDEKDSSVISDNVFDSLPPRNLKIACGSMRGPYLYFWAKDRGIEPGFFGIFLKNEKKQKTFFTALKKIIESANNFNVKERIDTFNGCADSLQDVVAHYIGYTSTRERKREPTFCARYIFLKLKEEGYPLLMIKMDYNDGQYVTCDYDSVSNQYGVRYISRMASYIGLEKSTRATATYASQKFKYKRYEIVSVEAFSEFLVTDVIARNILGKERVQKVNLVVRHNQISKNVLKNMYALEIEINLSFRDFSSHFIDGQRVSPYNHAMAVETLGLGKTAAMQIASGNNDAIGRGGANAGYDERGYFMIDLAKAYLSSNVSVAKRTNQMLLVRQGSDAKNFSIFDNTSLASRVRGLLLLAKANGIVTDSEIIKSHGADFEAQYEDVKDVARKLNKFYKKVREDFSNESVIRLHHDVIRKIGWRFKKSAHILIQKGKKFFNMTADEIDIYEGLTKLAVGKEGLTSYSYNQKVNLNRIRFKSYNPDSFPDCSILFSDKEHTVFSIAMSDIKAASVNDFLKKNNIKEVFEFDGLGRYNLTIHKQNLPYLKDKLTDENIATFFELSLAPLNVSEEKNDDESFYSDEISKVKTGSSLCPNRLCMDSADLIDRENSEAMSESGSALRPFLHAVLITAGVALAAIGMLALCSGVGALPGSFVAAAGAWLLSLAPCFAAVAVSSTVTGSGVAVAGVAIHGLFGGKPSQRLPRFANEKRPFCPSPGV